MRTQRRGRASFAAATSRKNWAPATWQIENEAALPERIAMNTHHRLEYLNPFTVGDGRVTVLLADTLLLALTDGTRVFDCIDDVPKHCGPPT